jgi:hypothetical protein
MFYLVNASSSLPKGNNLQRMSVRATRPHCTIELLVRGLSEASRRNLGTPMATLIGKYVTVQVGVRTSPHQGGNSRVVKVNAILASSNTSAGFYSSNWVTAPASSFSIDGTISALSVLNAAAFDSAPPSYVLSACYFVAGR